MSNHTQIPNEILDRLFQLPVPAMGFRLLLWIARESYGWQRKWTIPAGYRRLKKLLKFKMSRSSVQLAIKVLLEAHVIQKDDLGRWCINEAWEDWSDWAAQDVGRPAALGGD